MAVASPEDHLVWRTVDVDGRPAAYGEASGARPGGAVPEGQPPVVFLHGWALGQHSYKRALKRLAARGHRVVAPALPGFGGTAELAGREFSFAGYAGWVDRFCDVVEVEGPVVCVGHSFGGGVAIRFAHDFPARVARLVLVNSVGAAMVGRSLVSWGRHFPGEGLSLPGLTRVVPVVLEDAVPNLLRNPLAVLRVANLVRRADLAAELEELKRRRLPVAVLWGDHDRIIPRSAFEAVCEALGSAGEVVGGNHSWLLSDPDTFGDVITNVLAVKHVADDLGHDR